jgi:hypothetical protein
VELIRRVRPVNLQQLPGGTQRQLGNRHLGPHPPPERSRASTAPGQRGRPAGGHPVAGRQRCRRLRQPARPRSPAGNRQGDGKSRGDSYDIFKPALRRRHHLAARTEPEPVPVRGSAGHHPGHRKVDRPAGKWPERAARSQPRADCPRQEHRSTELPAIPAGLPSDLLERRPDMQQAEQNLIAANALIGAAKAAYFPTISLTGLFGYASSSLGNLFDSQSKVWQYAAPISMPIFTGRRHRRSGAGGGSATAASAVRLSEGHPASFREVNDALVDQDRTRVQLQAQKRQVAALQEYAGTARLRYENGYTSYIEVLDAERSLFNVQLQYTQTQQTQLQAMINLYKAMGGGWTRRPCNRSRHLPGQLTVGLIALASSHGQPDSWASSQESKRNHEQEKQVSKESQAERRTGDRVRNCRPRRQATPRSKRRRKRCPTRPTSRNSRSSRPNWCPPAGVGGREGPQGGDPLRRP